MPTEEARSCQEIAAQPPLPVTSNVNVFSAMPFPVTIGPVLLSMQGGNPLENSGIGKDFRVNNPSAMLVHHVPVVSMPPSSAMADLKFNQQVPPEASALSLRLSLSSSYRNGDSIVSVA